MFHGGGWVKDSQGRINLESQWETSWRSVRTNLEVFCGEILEIISGGISWGWFSIFLGILLCMNIDDGVSKFALFWTASSLFDKFWLYIFQLMVLNSRLSFFKSSSIHCAAPSFELMLSVPFCCFYLCLVWVVCSSMVEVMAQASH